MANASPPCHCLVLHDHSYAQPPLIDALDQREHLISEKGPQLVRERFAKDLHNLEYLFSKLEHDHDLKERFFSKSDELFVERFVKRAIVYSGFLDILPASDVESFFSFPVMVFVRCEDDVLNSVVTPIATSFATFLKNLLESETFAWFGVTYCSCILDNRFEDEIHGEGWGYDFLEDHLLLDCLKAIADNVDGKWDEDTVAQADELVPVETDSDGSGEPEHDSDFSEDSF